ncbi:L-histidine N(alpha)-methyltransferase, partial [Salibaculum sp.]|uniref:L-histidine N(alpha)-methyltransferase n=1 Tax=Salibaculum sp. TaxID=2855480 RepID=UPI002B474389
MRDLASRASLSGIAADAAQGLAERPRRLSPKWLYDAAGSALFEQITRLPEYYPTRTETAILRRHSDALAALIPSGGALVELGSGASAKTRILLEAAPHLGAYVPIDISADFLEETAQDLRRRFLALPVYPAVADFTRSVTLPGAVRALPKTAFFPGSTIGNLEPDVARDLLTDIRAWGDVRVLVLGADLVKDAATLVAAYDDSQGVTARFTTNALVRLAAEPGVRIDPDAFTYRASWNAGLARIDMELIARKAHTARIEEAEFAFAADEPILVSASRKYTPESHAALAEAGGWQLDMQYRDDNDLFAVAV